MGDVSQYKHRVSVKKTIAKPNEVFQGQFDATPPLNQLKDYLSSQHNIPAEISQGALEAKLGETSFRASFKPINCTREAYLEAEVSSTDHKIAQEVKSILKGYNQSF